MSFNILSSQKTSFGMFPSANPQHTGGAVLQAAEPLVRMTSSRCIRLRKRMTSSRCIRLRKGWHPLPRTPHRFSHLFLPQLQRVELELRVPVALVFQPADFGKITDVALGRLFGYRHFGGHGLVSLTGEPQR